MTATGASARWREFGAARLAGSGAVARLVRARTSGQVSATTKQHPQRAAGSNPPARPAFRRGSQRGKSSDGLTAAGRAGLTPPGAARYWTVHSAGDRNNSREPDGRAIHRCAVGEMSHATAASRAPVLGWRLLSCSPRRSPGVPADAKRLSQ
jgi:hypothetical protein